MRDLCIMSIEEQASDGVVGDFTVYVYDNAADEIFTVHATYVLRDRVIVVQSAGTPWDVIEYVSHHPFLNGEMREMVMSERDGLEQDALEAARVAKRETKVNVASRWLVN